MVVCKWLIMIMKCKKVDKGGDNYSKLGIRVSAKEINILMCLLSADS